MSDEEIVELYWSRSPTAIDQTAPGSMALIATPSPIKFWAAARMRRNGSAIPGWPPGIPFHLTALRFCVHFWARSPGSFTAPGSSYNVIWRRRDCYKRNGTAGSFRPN